MLILSLAVRCPCPSFRVYGLGFRVFAEIRSDEARLDPKIQTLASKNADGGLKLPLE